MRKTGSAHAHFVVIATPASRTFFWRYPTRPLFWTSTRAKESSVGSLENLQPVIYEEHASGAKTARPELAACLRACREGDTLVIWKLDRLGRNTKHLIEIAEDLAQRKIGLKTLTGFDIDTRTPHGRLALQMFAALAEYERALIQERILAGLAAARARGRKGGRRPKLSPDQQREAQILAKGRRPVAEIARKFGCARWTVYKALSQTTATVD